jgi:hypothetical protein
MIGELTSPAELLCCQCSVVLLYSDMSVTREATDKLHKLNTSLGETSGKF